ncbi:MAG: DUF4878 domain-containing protein [Pyrinomonadaceae bacterium]
MKPYRLILTSLFAFLIVACSTTPRYSTPFETLKAYTEAIKKKDYTTMKLLLSEASIKMHEEQAKQQGVTLDEIMQRETLFTPDQKSLSYRNIRIDGERATIEVKNSFGQYETVPFVLENGIWKIDKQGYFNQQLNDIEQQNNQKIDEIINQGRVQ